MVDWVGKPYTARNICGSKRDLGKQISASGPEQKHGVKSLLQLLNRNILAGSKVLATQAACRVTRA